MHARLQKHVPTLKIQLHLSQKKIVTMIIAGFSLDATINALAYITDTTIYTFGYFHK